VLKLAEVTGHNVWRKRALAGWYNGMIEISDGTLKLDGKKLPRGGQCEGYFHTRWGAFGETSIWLVVWPHAFRLETLRTLKNWDVLR